MKSKLTLAIALVLGAAGLVSGELASGVEFATGGFAQMDQNDDGYLTMDEMKGNKELMAHMKKVDKNKDHKLSNEEFNSFIEFD
jgi:hypothetical protein